MGLFSKIFATIKENTMFLIFEIPSTEISEDL